MIESAAVLGLKVGVPAPCQGWIGEVPPQLTLLTRFPSDTPSSLEAGAGVLGTSSGSGHGPTSGDFHAPPQAGHYLPVNSLPPSGVVMETKPGGKEGGHRGGGQSPQELTAWAPLS